MLRKTLSKIAGAVLFLMLLSPMGAVAEESEWSIGRYKAFYTQYEDDQVNTWIFGVANKCPILKSFMCGGSFHYGIPQRDTFDRDFGADISIHRVWKDDWAVSPVTGYKLAVFRTVDGHTLVRPMSRVGVRVRWDPKVHTHIEWRSLWFLHSIAVVMTFNP